jgi:hypothetical protein
MAKPFGGMGICEKKFGVIFPPKITKISYTLQMHEILE